MCPERLAALITVCVCVCVAEEPIDEWNVCVRLAVTQRAPVNNGHCVYGYFHTGIGRATALALARCGAEVVAVTRTLADLDSLLLEVTPATPIYTPPYPYNSGGRCRLRLERTCFFFFL